MDTRGQQLAETFLKMNNTHDPDLVDQFEAEGYVNHEALFSAEGARRTGSSGRRSSRRCPTSAPSWKTW